MHNYIAYCNINTYMHSYISHSYRSIPIVIELFNINLYKHSYRSTYIAIVLNINPYIQNHHIILTPRYIAIEILTPFQTHMLQPALSSKARQI